MKNASQDPTQIKLRLWPAVILVLVHIAALAYSFLFAHTLIQVLFSGVLIPLIVLIALSPLHPLAKYRPHPRPGR